MVVACSGGADSLSLVAAAVAEGRAAGVRVVGATVDHGLQEESRALAEAVVTRMAALGVDETLAARIRVEPGGRGMEAAAREARYAVLEAMAGQLGSQLVLLGHTRDDQAETVLLGLTRGSGGRSLAGMRRAFRPFARPFLDLTRAQTEQACRDQRLEPWSDPHNEDPRFTRARVRHRVLPVLEAELGPGVAATLARTADQLREDMELLDRLADAAYSEAVRDRAEGQVSLDVASLEGLDVALRRRVLRLAALAAGSPADELFRVHVLATEELVTAWRGQRMVQLPGHVAVTRAGSTLTWARGPVAG